MTTIAIIGLGNMGKGLAQRLSGKAELVLGARNADTAQAFAATLAGKVTVTDAAGAAASADLVVLALPYDAALDAARTLDLAGKVVVDMSNPVKADYSGLSIGYTTSAAEEIQAAAPGAKVVKAFNTVFAALFAAPAAATAEVPVFLAGNDAAAVDAVADLVGHAGFAVERTGGLDAARLIEPVGMLNIRFGYGLGLGTAIAPRWHRIAG